ncbi:MAG: hypothetical protein EAZ95_05910 [Bacteroidetes bacterium]|nr:MAG: hypothetical protein EAZ95_05910 [Bacteroidota bacterium]
MAQEAKKKDSLKPVAPSSVRILSNIYLPAHLFSSNKLTQLKSAEVSAEWWQKKGFAWVGEAGYAQRTRNGGTYNVQGTYLRLGIERGFWELQPARRALGAWQSGLRLAFASFQYQMQSEVISPYWGSIPFYDEQKGMFAMWAEWHTSLRARIGKRFMMGPMMRAKILLYAPKVTAVGKPPEIVGFGVRRGIQAEAGYWVGIWIGK